jgi:hypothetical protein
MAEGNGDGRVVAEAGRVVVAAAVVVGRVSADRGRCLCGLVTTMIRSSVSAILNDSLNDRTSANKLL